MDIKTAVVFFGLGLVQGMLLLDWIRDKQALRLLQPRELASPSPKREVRPKLA